MAAVVEVLGGALQLLCVSVLPVPAVAGAQPPKEVTAVAVKGPGGRVRRAQPGALAHQVVEHARGPGAQEQRPEVAVAKDRRAGVSMALARGAPPLRSAASPAPGVARVSAHRGSLRPREIFSSPGEEGAVLLRSRRRSGWAPRRPGSAGRRPGATANGSAPMSLSDEELLNEMEDDEWEDADDAMLDALLAADDANAAARRARVKDAISRLDPAEFAAADIAHRDKLLADFAAADAAHRDKLLAELATLGVPMPPLRDGQLPVQELSDIASLYVAFGRLFAKSKHVASASGGFGYSVGAPLDVAIDAEWPGGTRTSVAFCVCDTEVHLVVQTPGPRLQDPDDLAHEPIMWEFGETRQLHPPAVLRFLQSFQPQKVTQTSHAFATLLAGVRAIARGQLAATRARDRWYEDTNARPLRILATRVMASRREREFSGLIDKFPELREHPNVEMAVNNALAKYLDPIEPMASFYIGTPARPEPALTGYAGSMAVVKAVKAIARLDLDRSMRILLERVALAAEFAEAKAAAAERKEERRRARAVEAVGRAVVQRALQRVVDAAAERDARPTGCGQRTRPRARASTTPTAAARSARRGSACSGAGGAVRWSRARGRRSARAARGGGAPGRGDGAARGGTECGCAPAAGGGGAGACAAPLARARRR